MFVLFLFIINIFNENLQLRTRKQEKFKNEDPIPKTIYICYKTKSLPINLKEKIFMFSVLFLVSIFVYTNPNLKHRVIDNTVFNITEKKVSNELSVHEKKNNINVTGSDIAHNANTVNLEKYKIPVFIGHKSSNIKDRDIIFYSSAIKNNPEIKEAKKNKIPCYNRSKLLQLICKDKFTIVVSGSHGKTSTTSILGHLLVRAGLNPTIISGGIMQNFGQNIYLTDSNYVVVEADESDGTVFKLSPKYLLFLNNFLYFTFISFFKLKIFLIFFICEIPSDALSPGIR